MPLMYKKFPADITGCITELIHSVILNTSLSTAKGRWPESCAVIHYHRKFAKSKQMANTLHNTHWQRVNYVHWKVYSGQMNYRKSTHTNAFQGLAWIRERRPAESSSCLSTRRLHLERVNKESLSFYNVGDSLQFWKALVIIAINQSLTNMRQWLIQRTKSHTYTWIKIAKRPTLGMLCMSIPQPWMSLCHWTR